MKAGRMNCRIEAYEPVSVKGSFGDTSTTWVSRGLWFAERVSLSGKRVEEAAEVFADYSAKYNIRAQHAIAPGWRIDGDDGLLYDVCAVEPNRRRGMLTLICQRVNR